MHTDNNYYFHEGWQDYYEGLNRADNPYHQPSDEYWDWDEGHDAAYLQDNRTG